MKKIFLVVLMAVGLAAFCFLEGRRFFDGSSPSELGHWSLRSGQNPALQRYREERRVIETILSDPRGLGGMYPGLLKESEIFPDPQEFKDIAINMRTLAFRLGLSVPVIPKDYEEYQNIYSDLMGWPHVQKPGEFRSLLVAQIQKEREAGTSEETKFAQDAEMAQRFSDCLKKIQEAKEIARIARAYKAKKQSNVFDEWDAALRDPNNIGSLSSAERARASRPSVPGGIEMARNAAEYQKTYFPTPYVPTPDKPSSASSTSYSLITLPDGQTASVLTFH